MISPRLRELIESARAVLPEDGEWQMMNAMPRREPRPLTIPVPEDYAELLRVSDGLGCGCVTVFDGNYVARSQIYADPIEGVPITLEPDAWFCFGTVVDDPLLIDRRTGAVHHFPDTGVVWWMSDRFEQIAADLDGFLTEHVFGPGYPALTGIGDDQWCRLLRRLGRLT